MWRCACALALLCCAAPARSGIIKRAEMATAPFVLGSRYGRSPPRMISPRNDRFFMGSRYGKRSQQPSHKPAHPLRIFTDAPWRGIAYLCELPALAPICQRRRLSSKTLYNRISQRRAEKTGYN